jgi:hypothetical protein
VAERADGWMPLTMGPQGLAESRQKLRELADEAGRTRPIRIAARANTAYTPEPFEGEGRQAFQGSVAQLVEDIASHAAVLDGAEDPSFIIDLTTTVWDSHELADVADELFTMMREAGI